MASCSLRRSLDWDETQCLKFYGLLSLHEVFKVVGSQLTDADIDVLSFLLSETCAPVHPMDPAGWTVKPEEDNPLNPGEAPSPKLLAAWKRLQSQGFPQPMVAWFKPRSGLELLLELERRGYISEGNLEPLLQLLRVLTRHDLLPLVSHKRRRTVSPERTDKRSLVEHRELLCTSGPRVSSYRQAEMSLPSSTQQVRTGFDPPVAGGSLQRRRRRRKGHGWSRKPKKTSRQAQQLPPAAPSQKASCNIRLRVRAEYLEHESALRDGVSSDKRQPLERQFELFRQADSLLRARDLGAIVCDIKFTELDNLEAFWVDYLSGALLEALKGVFITDSLRVAAGSEGVRLLISVDQDDYEEGRRLLSAGVAAVIHCRPQGQSLRGVGGL
ncbi:death effector domain-containing 1 [Hippocampus comes]|uniref:Death effector domain-containing 1 n=1 Tax=Hippocampus comes TaxID=109280 RepID=A0A3Q2XX55_HIPCM|nr:PREDICTED: DNA-binding death effector domain-containing protein 2 [Hippocampus comes]XP_019751687.1 PREDICTED: DNA-binding death effector domain-containing protein 2 [Hippocampus comes]